MNGTTPYANSVFEQPWWLDIVAPGAWGEVFVKEGEEVVARMPYVLKKGRICMPPMTQTLGPWIKPEYRMYQPGNTQLSKQKEIIAELLGQLPAHKSINIALDSSNEYILPYRWHGFRYEPTFSYRLCNLKDMDAIHQNLNKTAKKNIRRAAERVQIVSQAGTEDLQRLIQITFEAQKRNVPSRLQLVEQVVRTALERGNGKILTAVDEQGNLHASSFIVYDDKVCYDLVGGSDPQYRTSGAKSLVLWEAIRSASETSEVFDFEGSNVEGIENFFRQFGGRTVINYRIIKQSLIADCLEMAKPRIKKWIGYRI